VDAIETFPAPEGSHSVTDLVGELTTEPPMANYATIVFDPPLTIDSEAPAQDIQDRIVRFTTLHLE
jgi:hypothetical protein